MSQAYVDTSALVAIAFGERDGRRIEAGLRRFKRLFSSNLLEAELRSTLAREGVADKATTLLSGITWVYPNRPLTPEYERVLAAGYLRGADLWHVAHALFLSPTPTELAFLTFDDRQREVVSALGFVT